MLLLFKQRKERKKVSKSDFFSRYRQLTIFITTVQGLQKKQQKTLIFEIIHRDL